MATCMDCGRSGLLLKRICRISFLYEFTNKDPKHEVWIHTGLGSDTTVYTQGGYLFSGKKIKAIDPYVDRNGEISRHIHRGRPVIKHACKEKRQRIEVAARATGYRED